jgi:NADPH-dependent glutamate synthase beta subunit-like oxidoreductase
MKEMNVKRIPYSVVPADGSPIPTCCQRACPVETDVSAYVSLIAKRDFEGALAVVREANPFPGVCGRVCDHACEHHCRRADSDAPVGIRALKRVLADIDLKSPCITERISPTRAEKVAIIGSGPAGLTAASDLVRNGFAVTVFEALPLPGGMMRYGIPDYRLPSDALDHDIDRLTQMGVAIKTGCALGREFTLESLRSDGYSAILLATGAHAGKSLGIPGDDSRHVRSGIDFLREVKSGVPEDFTRVIVIGGGDVAMDTARTALRNGAESVDLYCLEQKKEMPAHEWETKEAVDEDIKLHCGWGPVEIRDRGDACEVVFQECVSVFDSAGRFAPTFNAANKTVAVADTVLVSIGQSAVFAHRAEDGIETTRRGLYQVDSDSLQTTAPWVFAAGDAASGPATVIKAIASGHRAAASMREYLDGKTLTGVWHPVSLSTRPERDTDVAEWELIPRAEEPELSSTQRKSSFAEVRLGLLENDAVQEAARCLRCDAATRSYSYSREMREQIYHEARDIESAEASCLEFLSQKLEARPNQRASDSPASLEDLVFLPANLTRLVIDPYREKCNTKVVLGHKSAKPVELAGPILVGGIPLDLLDAPVAEAVLAGVALSGSVFRRGSLSSMPSSTTRVIQAIAIGDGSEAADRVPDLLPNAVMLELTLPPAFPEARLRRVLADLRISAPGLPIGMAIAEADLEFNLKLAVECGLDFVSVNAMSHESNAGQTDWSDREGTPVIESLPRVVELLRAWNCEEEVEILYFGGVRNGADVARLICLGATAVMYGEAALIAVGAEDDAPNPERLSRFVTASLMEVSMLARCCGKTDVRNLEPEDLRSLTIATSAATRIALVGSDEILTTERLG